MIITLDRSIARVRRLLMLTMFELGASWQRAPTILVLGVIIFAGYKIDAGSIVWPLLAFYALAWFACRTWPQRWLIDGIIFWCLLVGSIDFVLLHGGLGR